MTRLQLERVIRTWQERLRLDHWENPCGDAYHALISIDDDYARAKLKLDRIWPTWKREHANRTIVHELLHVHEHGIPLAASSLEVLIGKPAWTVFENRLVHEREKLVDGLSVILVELAGCV